MTVVRRTAVAALAVAFAGGLVACDNSSPAAVPRFVPATPTATCTTALCPEASSEPGASATTDPMAVSTMTLRVAVAYKNARDDGSHCLPTDVANVVFVDGVLVTAPEPQRIEGICSLIGTAQIPQTSVGGSVSATVSVGATAQTSTPTVMPSTVGVPMVLIIAS